MPGFIWPSWMTSSRWLWQLCSTWFAEKWASKALWMNLRVMWPYSWSIYSYIFPWSSINTSMALETLPGTVTPDNTAPGNDSTLQRKCISENEISQCCSSSTRSSSCGLNILLGWTSPWRGGFRYVLLGRGSKVDPGHTWWSSKFFFFFALEDISPSNQVLSGHMGSVVYSRSCTWF